MLNTTTIGFNPQKLKRSQKFSIFWIVVFLITLLFSLILSFAVLILAIYASFILLSEIKINVLTIIISLGICIMSALMVYFTIKYISSFFEKFENDGIEIKEEDYPELFRLIYETAEEVGTKKPKKVYLDSIINANVRYSNIFRSLFLPTRKNLTIGVGILQMCTVDEFKGVLAHEFGHFSQKSMIIGSYVSNVNRILYKNLYGKDEMENLIESLEHFNGFVALISRGAILYNKIFQKIYEKIYENLNFHFLTLSREMEFQADIIATKVVGIENMVPFFLRIELYNYAYSQVVDFYVNNSDEEKYSINYYKDLNKIVEWYANENNISVENGLPQPHLFQILENNSKLLLENIWSTHPSPQESITNIEKTEIHSTSNNTSVAKILIPNIEKFEVDFTEDFFINLGVVRKNLITEEEFINEFIQKNNYYIDSKFYYNLFKYAYLNYNKIYKIANLKEENSTTVYKNIFSEELTNEFKNLYINKSDLEILQSIKSQKKIKSFLYDNKPYNRKSIDSLIDQLTKEIELDDEKILGKLEEINAFFGENITQSNRALLDSGKIIEDEYIKIVELVNDIRENTKFLFKVSHQKIIKEGVQFMHKKNEELKEELKFILNYTNIEKLLKNHKIEYFNRYIEETQIFYDEVYYDQVIVEFFEVVNFLDEAIIMLKYDNTRNFLRSFENLLTDNNVVNEKN